MKLITVPWWLGLTRTWICTLLWKQQRVAWWTLRLFVSGTCRCNWTWSKMLFLLVFILENYFVIGQGFNVPVAECNTTYLWMLILWILILRGFAMPKMTTWCSFTAHIELLTVPQCSCEGTKYVKIIIETSNVSVNKRQTFGLSMKGKGFNYFYCEGWILGISALRNTK